MITSRGKTIQIFLPSGNPSGIKVAEVTTRAIQAIEVPRILLSDFLQMSESKQVGIYYLFSTDEIDRKPSVYIGQSEDLRVRLGEHDKKRGFWDHVVIFVSSKNNLTKTHALYLEYISITKAVLAKRYNLENANKGSEPHTTLGARSECEEYYELMSILIDTLGYALFKPILDQNISTSDEFYCKRNRCDAKGVLTEEGFVVLANSILSEEVNKSFEAKNGYSRLHSKLIEQEVIITDRGKQIFVQDYLFKSPSAASSVLIGQSSNGWVDWKNNADQTLDKVKRQLLDTSKD